MKHKHTQEDYEFMNSLSEVMALKSPRRSKLVILFWLFTVIFFIVWASFTQIDEITRGDGKVISSGKNQMIQNLEGGIVKDIFVNIGDIVEKGQSLLKIDNRKSESQKEATQIKALELKAKIIRLRAEAQNSEFVVSLNIEKLNPLLIENERSLYLSRKEQYRASIRVLEAQKRQREEELLEMRNRVSYLKTSVNLINKEVAITRPMVKQGVKSKVAFIQLRREQNKIKQELNTAKLTIPSFKSSIVEIENKISEAQSSFRNQAKQELNEVIAESMRVKESFNALENEIERTLVKSPMKGIVQDIFIHTIGGVIKAGEDLVEIVPLDESALLIEIKIKPSDVAFIYPNQEAIVKISAYDFAIYGSLTGKIVHISADTLEDKKENTFYRVDIKTDKNYLGSDKKPLKIIPGMTVSVDIMTGKKSIMDYILKPILRAKQYTFTER